FYKELHNHINPETELCIQCQSTTFLTLAKFLTGLNGCRKINVLIGAEKKTLENFTSAEVDVKVQNELETLRQAINLMESSSNTLSIRSGYCGLNLIILKDSEQTRSYLYAQDPLDTQVLGYAPAKGAINITPLAADISQSYYQQFSNTWSESTEIDSLYQLLQWNIAATLPRWQYLYTLDHLFADYERLEQYEKIEKTGFFRSKVWNLLYNFQKDAVLGAIDKI